MTSALEVIRKELPKFLREHARGKLYERPSDSVMGGTEIARDVGFGDVAEAALPLAAYAPDAEGAPVMKGLKSVREAIMGADATLKQAKSAGHTGVIINKSQALRVLPKTDSPYIDTPQFLPERQPVRTKAGVPQYNERTQDLLDNPAAKSAILRNMRRGDILGMREWYGSKPLYEAAMQEGQTPEEFNRMMMHLASASQRSPVPGQIKRGSATWVAEKQGKLAPDAPSYTLPPGYGSLAQKDIIKRAYEIAGGKGLDPTAKLGRFHQNLIGNLDPVTVDVMALRGPILATKDPRWLATAVREKNLKTGEINTLTPRKDFESGKLDVKTALRRPGLWEAAPKGAEYNAFEDLYRQMAKKHGAAPAEGQAVAWYGSGAEAGLRTEPKTFMQHLEDRILDTAAKRNETPGQVLRAMLRGEKPLMGVAAGVPIADQLQGEQ